MARPDTDINPRRTWARTLNAAASMTGPLVLVCLYACCELAALSGWIPERWERFDSLLSAVFLMATILLVARHAARIAEHAELVEQQRDAWAGRSGYIVRGSDEDAMAAVRELQDMIEIREIQVAAMVDAFREVSLEIGRPDLADRIPFRIYQGGRSRRPAV